MYFLKSPFSFAVHTYLDYKPRILRRQTSNRKHSSFLYVQRGMYRYSFSGGGFSAGDGALVYLPQGGNYYYEVLRTDTKCLQIELDILSDDGRHAVFFDTPSIVGYYPHNEMERVFSDIKQSTQSFYGDSAALCGVYALLLPILGMRKTWQNKPKSKISPAVEYIHAHYSENIPVRLLADMCFLSETQMRRIFRKEHKCSPHAYKKRILLEAAQDLLQTSSCAVSDIADSLGFSSLYAFSRFFKKEQGVSPSVFRKRCAETDISDA